MADDKEEVIADPSYIETAFKRMSVGNDDINLHNFESRSLNLDRKSNSNHR